MSHVAALHPVKSTAMSHVGYDPTTQTLAIRFPTGVYHFRDVPAEKHAALLKAPSKGSFFAAHIRDAFDSEKVV